MPYDRAIPRRYDWTKVAVGIHENNSSDKVVSDEDAVATTEPNGTVCN